MPSFAAERLTFFLISLFDLELETTARSLAVLTPEGFFIGAEDSFSFAAGDGFFPDGWGALITVADEVFFRSVGDSFFNFDGADDSFFEVFRMLFFPTIVFDCESNLAVSPSVFATDSFLEATI